MEEKFKKYLPDNAGEYYDSKLVISILEQELSKGLEQIKTEVNDAVVKVTEEDIKKFLDEKFSEEDPELKERIENPKPRSEKSVIEWTKEDIKEDTQRFVDELCANRYCFNSYTLEYFKRYTTIVKNKALQLINIIESIGTKETTNIKDLLGELDINLDEFGNIKGEDIERLITPTIQNIEDLNEKINKANNLETYLTFKISRESLLREGISENEIYPSTSIIIKGLYGGHRKGNVPISDNQEEELYKEFKESSKKFARILTNL